ncbi:MAG: hypothetical protein RR162_03655 [Oscillospiraceae bacterium]
MKTKFEIHKMIADMGYAVIIVPLLLKRLGFFEGVSGLIAQVVISAVIGIIMLYNMLAANKIATENDKKYSKAQIWFLIVYIIGVFFALAFNYYLDSMVV